MAISKAQQRATAKYVSKSYDRIEAKVPKGQKVVIQAHAEAVDGTLNKFLNRAINETMERDVSGAPPESPCKGRDGPQGVGVVSLPSETMETAQRAAGATGEELPQFVTRAVEMQAKRDEPSLLMGINPATGEKLEGKGGADNDRPH